MKIKILAIGLLLHSSGVFAGNGTVIGAVAPEAHLMMVPDTEFRSHLREAMTKNTVTLSGTEHKVVEASAINATIRLEDLTIHPNTSYLNEGQLLHR